MSDYSNIIDHPHHQSATRPHMSMINRAAQFSPFAALTGYGDCVEETRRLTEEKVILDDDAIAELNRKLQEIEAGNRLVAITFFAPDPLKSGGAYTIISGEVKKIDTIENKVVMTDGAVVPIDDIFDISFLG